MSHRLRVSAILACLVAVAAVAGAAIPPLERQALLDLYAATGGEQWLRADGWLGPAGTECGWYGVVCDPAESAVTGLMLEANRLRGSLPASLVDLGALAYANLRGNALERALPWQDSMLVDLERLTKYGGHICLPHDTNLCINQQRFRVNVAWKDFEGNTGVGQAVPLTSDTGYFWFFKETNVELIVKVLDGTAMNGYFWVFYGALSNVEYTLTVADSTTGNAITYHNEANNFASVGDTSALPEAPVEEGTKHRVVEVTEGRWDPSAFALISELATRDRPPLPKTTAGDCSPGAENLCLNDGRFKVEVAWEDFDGNTGSGQAVALTGDTGYFWFFRSSNVELVVKVLDGRFVNDYFWVFYGALSNVAYTITVTDTDNDEVKTYTNPEGEFGSLGDAYAFYRP